MEPAPEGGKNRAVVRVWRLHRRAAMEPAPEGGKNLPESLAIAARETGRNGARPGGREERRLQDPEHPGLQAAAMEPAPEGGENA